MPGDTAALSAAVDVLNCAAHVPRLWQHSLFAQSTREGMILIEVHGVHVHMRVVRG